MPRVTMAYRERQSTATTIAPDFMETSREVVAANNMESDESEPTNGLAERSPSDSGSTETVSPDNIQSGGIIDTEPNLFIPPNPEDTANSFDGVSPSISTDDPSSRSRTFQHHPHSHPPHHHHNHPHDPARLREHTLHHLRLRDLPQPATPTSPSLPASEPGSPMSFASMPSYVASISSLSRASSAASAAGGDDVDANDDVSGNLVLPQLNLPSESLSLHLSLQRWPGRNVEVEDEKDERRSAVTVALIGTKDEIEKVLKEVKESVEMVKLDGGELGIISDGRVAIRLITGHKIDQVQNKVYQGYQTLNALLSPVPPPSGEIEKSSDDLEGMIPVTKISTNGFTHESISSTPSAVSDRATHPSQISDSRLHGPTPRARDDMDGYFASQHLCSPLTSSGSAAEPASTHSVNSTGTSRSPSILRERIAPMSIAARTLCDLLSSPSTLVYQSTTSFIAWRYSPSGPPSPSMTPISVSASASAYASASSSYGFGGNPMPTVARAQGGGEWEANLSRRVAQRRESEGRSVSLSRLGSGRGKGSTFKARPRRRRRSLEKAEQEKACQSLFPNIPSSSLSHSQGKMRSSGFGIGWLVGKTFGIGVESVKGMKTWWATKGVWKWGVVAAIVVIGGMGLWAKSRV
ncbi:hypothetical protein I307_02371 [Cryptococcus deuterogattii 99/473]|uniref:Unplaced genomic scaffold supercont1.16, whole genome shotgun sequence n=1 Tax=Cryptococcus deuterogattii Ram5 TaxID=1296110 RepID=A0A0D0UVZ8_9TREE|nr:hypothetical protein I313_05872 [Cryptococcus deuterogattii Ram5]KIR73563.1 hypothetical protein I310_02235 [Cryptococcus deuterogattii CA1014]KIR99684.1 hypothetical protein L804_03316 [Cryptococcus deuterogattii 2001/935-1]KIY58123.1 hypothetical protein I307_02371 [Cryptococcus deuterogattii 99/473]